MPLREYNTPADFLRDYSSPYVPTANNAVEGQAFPGVAMSYDVRWFGLRVGKSHARKIVAVLNPDPAASLLIVGSGFGWTVEVLETEFGFTNVLGIDTSPYVHSVKDSDDEPEIDAAISHLPADLQAEIKSFAHTPGPRVRTSFQDGVANEDLSTGRSKGAVKQFLGVQGQDKITLGVSELLLDVLTDAEAVTISDDMNDVCDRVVHYVLESPRETIDADFNVKTLEEWKALLPNDEFYDPFGRLV